MRTYRQPGTVLTDHHFSVPLDHGKPDGERIGVFGREVVAAGNAGGRALPWLVYLQGGPGFAAPRPAGRSSWLDRALDDYRVLLLDQRGTGRSTPLTARSLARLGPPAAQAEYLARFRADSIVLDCELVRRDLCGPDEQWTVLGQSFGGFCAVTYLSFAPHGIRDALLTGGLPGLDARPEDVYRLTYAVVAARNAAHYDRYPDDVEAARDVARHLAAHDVRLPDGSPLTVERFQSIGAMLGAADGSHELHYLLEDPWDGDGGLSDAFLADVADRAGFLRAPLYAVLHEACYAQGPATRWAAQRVRAEFPAFDPAAAVDGDAPLLFTGEMVYPWMFDADPALVAAAGSGGAARASGTGGRRCTTRPGSPPTRCPSRRPSTTTTCTCRRRCRCAPPRRSRGLRAWVTNEWEHDGLRVSGGKVLGRLIAMNQRRGLTERCRAADRGREAVPGMPVQCSTIVSMNTVIVGTGPVSFADVVAVARGGAAVALSPAAEAEISASRKVIDALAHDAAPHYGVSTGFGALATRHIPAGAARPAAALPGPLARRRVRAGGRGRGRPGDDAAAPVDPGDRPDRRAAGGGARLRGDAQRGHHPRRAGVRVPRLLRRPGAARPLRARRHGRGHRPGQRRAGGAAGTGGPGRRCPRPRPSRRPASRRSPSPRRRASR